jgi:translation initiation factor 2B subunit (eIF-2B alpha/beta/delta family)
VFPEYAVPIECLPKLWELSSAKGIGVIAGSHVVELTEESHKTIYAQIGAEDIIDRDLDGFAVCPILLPQGLRYVQKLTKSKFLGEQQLKTPAENAVWDLVSVPCDSGMINIRIFLCSDFLERTRKQVTTVTAGRSSSESDLTVVLSFTPALGEFITQAAAEIPSSFTTAVNSASSMARSGPVAFVNEASRGGTKLFYNMPDPRRWLLEENDGYCGETEFVGGEVRICGLKPKCEAVVVSDLEYGDGFWRASPVTMCPIVHCDGPSDDHVTRWRAFLTEYQKQRNLEEKKHFFQGKRLYLHTTFGERWPLLRWRLEPLQNNLSRFKASDEEILDRMVCDLLILSEEIPSVDKWRARARRASIVKLNEVRHLSPRVVDRLVAKYNLSEPMREDSRFTSEQLVSASEVFLNEITKQLSSGTVAEKGARWLSHVLRTHTLEDVHEVHNRIAMVRPLGAVVKGILEPIVGDSTQQDIEDAATKLDNFAVQQEKWTKEMLNCCVDRLPECIGCDAEVVVVYGYSSPVLKLLTEHARRKGSEKDTVTLLVAECRNRADRQEGFQYAKSLTLLDIKVKFASDMSTFRALFDGKAKAVFMGFHAAGAAGVANTIGSLAMAVAARNGGGKVVFVGVGKVQSKGKWLSEEAKLRQQQRHGEWLRLQGQWADDLRKSNVDCSDYDYSSDVVPWTLVDWVMTEQGAYTAEEMLGRL